MSWNEDQINQIADDYWQNRQARCPIDKTILTIRERRALGKTTTDLVVHCPRCGSTSFWPIKTGKSEKLEGKVIPAGKEFTARKTLKDIIAGAKSKIEIVDPYFKGIEAFSLLLDLPISIKVEVITSSKTDKSSLSVDLIKFKKEWGGQIDIKTSEGLHARHIIIDEGKEVFVIDHSLKDAGMALTSIYKPDDAKEVIKHFNEKWASGKIVEASSVEKESFVATKGEKQRIRETLVEKGITAWKEKGQAKTVLLSEYDYYSDKGWTREEFEEIYKTISIRLKDKEPKSKLFDEV
jgi:hypothetical protein